MKNQYVGDIGDYGKYALLRALSRSFSLGVNWYLTTDDNKSDGKYINYLKLDADSLDGELFQMLKTLLFNTAGEMITDNRNISAVEHSGILPNALFWNELLDFMTVADRKAHRTNWVERSLHALSQSDIIFLDPDNGLEVKSIAPTGKHGNKFVAYDEVLQFYKAARVAVVIYNHRDRLPHSEYVKRFLRFNELPETRYSAVYRLTFHKTSVRDYVFIVKPEYAEIIENFLCDFVAPPRDKYFRLGAI